MHQHSNVYDSFVTLVNSSVIGALKTCNWSVEHDDALQIGWEALLICLKKREDSKGNGFYSYARLRVRGSVLDEAKKQTKLRTVDGVQKRLNNTPLALDEFDEHVIDEIVGSVEMPCTFISFDAIVNLLDNKFDRLVTILNIKYGLSSVAISKLLGSYQQKVDSRRKAALSILKKDILQSDYRD